MPRLTETLVVASSVRPSLSVTVSVAVYVPKLAYAWLRVAPDPVVPPSPKSHTYAVIEPSASDEALPSNAICWLHAAGFGVAVKLAIGGASGTAITRYVAFDSTPLTTTQARYGPT